MTSTAHEDQFLPHPDDVAQAQPKRRPYNASASLSEYGVFPECDAAPAAQPTASAEPSDVLSENEWYDLAQRHATKDWDGNGFLAAIQEVCMDFLSKLRAAGEVATHSLQPSTGNLQPVACAFFTEKGEVAYTGIYDRTLKALEKVRATRLGISSGSIDLYAAPVPAQKADDNDVVYLGGSAPPIPRWVVDSADRIAKYMDANWPGEWALGRIQSRATQKAGDARDAERWREWRRGKAISVKTSKSIHYFAPRPEPDFAECLEAAIDAGIAQQRKGEGGGND